MHHIYTTEAFVIHSAPQGEAGKFLLLFTKDFGMIGVMAQGIRLIKSKLRHHVQDYSYCMVSIVRGKEVWRLTGASEIKNYDLKQKEILHIKILKLLRRLLQGEEKNEKLFEIINELYRMEIKKEDIDTIEYIIVLRILNNLGYISNLNFKEILNNNEISENIISKAINQKSFIIKAINLALQESQL